MNPLGSFFRIFTCFVLLFAGGNTLTAAPYAAMVMDARSGKVIHSRNADTKLHPASLTKMMTLYIAFEAVERGEISLDTKVTITSLAANEPPSKLGLRQGQKIALRYLIRAAAVKSANDAATAIGQAISGSEKAFAQRMTRTARAMGMRNTTFRNAHGLTQSGHLSTASDMTVLGRHILYDYPDYYNLFSRKQASAGIKNVRNTNRRLLANYSGADGIKTGYTRAAGFNLVASAKRGDERIIATVFGGKSTASRNAQVAKLLDLGFSKAPTRVALRRPRLPAYVAPNAVTVQPKVVKAPVAAKPVPVIKAVAKSLRPVARPAPPVKEDIILVAAQPAEIQNIIEDALSVPAEKLTQVITPVTQIQPTFAPAAVTIQPVARPVEEIQPKVVAVAPSTLADPGSTDWAINIGKYTSRGQADRVLLRTALAEMVALDGATRKVQRKTQGYDAMFVGMTRSQADLACRRLQAQQIMCLMVSPG